MTHRKSVRTKPKRAILKEKWLLPMGIFVVAFFYFGYLRPANRQTAEAPVVRTGSALNSSSIPAFYQSAVAAQPFPNILSPALFKNDATAARAYEIAQKSPGLLAQLPCYCWCSRHEGHRSLLDCYASRHAATCDICIKEALLADELSRRGEAPEKIRAAIVRGDWGRTH